MIAARWRLMRSWETETDLYNQALEANTAELPTIRRRTQAFQQLTANGDVEKLGRYENRISRDYDRCLRRLTELQTARQRRQQQERKERDRLPTPINHTDLLSTDEYIRLQRKEKFTSSASGQNKPNPPAGTAGSATGSTSG
ncbi:MAG: hypothetical protein NTY38_14695, partial [Acidobacteria bacterium]|nr:hypothetical protein [Acidobacteriota bacterium]